MSSGTSSGWSFGRHSIISCTEQERQLVLTSSVSFTIAWAVEKEEILVSN
jgi:hypothetical protein